MTTNAACAVSDFLLACPLATPSTLEMLEPKAVPGNPKSSECDRRRSIQETIRTLLARGIIQKQVVPNLPRQFRRAEPVYARSVKFSETRLNYSVSAEIRTRPVVPLVSRTVYFLTSHADLFNQLLTRHESVRHNDDLAPDNLSPLAVVLRLANFFAEHSMLAGEKIEVPLILKGSVPQHWIGRRPQARIPLAPLADWYFADRPWRTLASADMLRWPSSANIAVTVVSVARAIRHSSALIALANAPYKRKAYELDICFDTCITSLIDYRDDAHLFLALS